MPPIDEWRTIVIEYMHAQGCTCAALGIHLGSLFQTADGPITSVGFEHDVECKFTREYLRRKAAHHHLEGWKHPVSLN